MSIEANHLDLAYALVETMNETISSFDELVSFLKEVPTDDLHSQLLSSIKHDDVFEIRLAPVIESTTDLN